MTNLPPSTSTRGVVDLTYQRCDQENIIEQLQNGIAGMRMPTGGLLSNAAFLTSIDGYIKSGADSTVED